MNYKTAVVLVLGVFLALASQAASAEPDVFMLRGSSPQSIEILDSDSHLVVDTISLSGFYEAFAIHPNGQLIYALRAFDNELDVIDIATKSVTKTIVPSVDRPSELIFDVSRKRAYVAGTLLDAVIALSIIDTELHEEIDTDTVAMLADDISSARNIEMALSENSASLYILKHNSVAGSTPAFVVRSLDTGTDFDLLPGGESLEEALAIRPQNDSVLSVRRPQGDDCFWVDDRPFSGPQSYDTLGISGCPGIAMNHDGSKLYIPTRSFQAGVQPSVRIIEYFAKVSIDSITLNTTNPNRIAYHPRRDTLYVSGGAFVDESYVINAANNGLMSTLDFWVRDIEFLPGCGDGLPGFGESCDDGNTRNGDGCSNRCRIEDDWKCSNPQAALVVNNEVLDGGFESGKPSANWTTTGSEAICSVATCNNLNGGMPDQGDWFVRFGGNDSGTFNASVTQDLIIPADADILTYRLASPDCGLNTHSLNVRIDGQLLKSYPWAFCTVFGYRLESIDISDFADGQLHSLTFDGFVSVPAIFGDDKTFLLDDIRIGKQVPSICAAGLNQAESCGSIGFVPITNYTLSTAVAGRIVDVDLTFDMTHEDPEFLTIRFNHNGIARNVFSGTSCEEANLDVLFDDEADLPFEFGNCSQFSGLFGSLKPVEPLSIVDHDDPITVSFTVLTTVDSTLNEGCLLVTTDGCPVDASLPPLVLQNSINPQQNAQRLQDWLADIGIQEGGIAHTVDFETGFVEGQGISGAAGVFPGGLVISDLSAGAAFVSGLPFNFGNSNPVGSLALSTPEAPSLDLDFSAAPVDYVAFDSIDHEGLSGTIFFASGDSTCFEFEQTDTNGDTAEFHGLFRGGNAAIERVELTAVSDDGKWGIDNLRYGVADTDGDGVSNSIDNCTDVVNPLQCDGDNDGYGNGCDADFDNSGGIVNFGDLALFADAFGTPNPDIDLDCSGGIVNFGDLAAFATRFGLAPGPSGLVQ